MVKAKNKMIERSFPAIYRSVSAKGLLVTLPGIEAASSCSTLVPPPTR